MVSELNADSGPNLIKLLGDYLDTLLCSVNLTELGA